MDLENEIWKPIARTNGQYEASNMGRVRSVFWYSRGSKGKIKIPRIKIMSGYGHNYGYCVTNIHQSNHMTHRLIAETFLPNPENFPQVNHINGKKDDNRVENLEWVTCQENCRHAWKMKPHRPAAHHVLNPEKVLEIKRLIRDGSIKDSEIARRFGVWQTAITKIRMGHTWKSVKLPEDIHG